MIGNWLGALPSTPTCQIRRGGGGSAEVDFIPGAKGHGL
jgi:hypothetical protein